MAKLGGYPRRHGIDDSRGDRRKSGEGVEFDRSCASGQEEKSQHPGDQHQSRAAVFRAKKAEKESQHNQKRKNSGSGFEPKAGCIGISRDEFPKEIQGSRGEGL